MLPGVQGRAEAILFRPHERDIGAAAGSSRVRRVLLRRSTSRQAGLVRERRVRGRAGTQQPAAGRHDPSGACKAGASVSNPTGGSQLRCTSAVRRAPKRPGRTGPGASECATGCFSPTRRRRRWLAPVPGGLRHRAHARVEMRESPCSHAPCRRSLFRPVLSVVDGCCGCQGTGGVCSSRWGVRAVRADLQFGGVAVDYPHPAALFARGGRRTCAWPPGGSGGPARSLSGRGGTVACGPGGADHDWPGAQMIRSRWSRKQWIYLGLYVVAGETIELLRGDWSWLHVFQIFAPWPWIMWHFPRLRPLRLQRDRPSGRNGGPEAQAEG